MVAYVMKYRKKNGVRVMMSSRLRFAAPVAAAMAGVFLAGCTSNSSSGTVPAPAASTTAAASPSASASPSSAGTGAASVPECTAAQLRIEYTDNSQIKQGALDGMSHADNVVMFTNTGSAPCQTGGYPGVAALDSAGRQIMQAVRSSEAGRLITLAPGAVASALVSANTASCTSLTKVAGLLVTAPNQRTSSRLGPAGTFCLNSLQVGTLHPGNAAGMSL
jgi:Protein of unknown function (DUF4232)